MLLEQVTPIYGVLPQPEVSVREINEVFYDKENNYVNDSCEVDYLKNNT